MSFADWSDKKKKERERVNPREDSKSGSFGEWSDEKQANSVDQTYLTTFFEEANKFLSSAEQDYNGVGWENASSAYNSRMSVFSDLGSRSSIIRKWLENNKNSINMSTYQSISSALDDFDSGASTIIDSFKKASEFYSKFDSEDSWKKYDMGWLSEDAEYDEESVAKRKEYYQSNMERLKELEEKTNGGKQDAFSWLWNGVDKQSEQNALIEEYEALKAETTRYEREQKALDDHYQTVTPEFTQGAANRNFTNATMEELWYHDSQFENYAEKLNNSQFAGGSQGDDGTIYDENGDVVYASNAYALAHLENTKDEFFNSIVQDKLGMYLSASAEDVNEAWDFLPSMVSGNHNNTWAKLILEGENNAWKQLNDHEIDTYYYYLNTQGQEAAYQYLDDMTVLLTKRATQKRADAISETSVLEQIALNIASIPMNIVGGAFALAGDLGNAMAGNDYNPYSAAHGLSNLGTAIRQDTAMDINNATGNFATPLTGTTFGDAYQAIMSMTDSMVGVALGSGAYGVLMGMGAATSTMKDMYEKGATMDQMALGGVLSGAFEMFFEKYSIDKLVSIKDTKSFKTLFINALKQGGIEASEEAFTEMANIATNHIIMGSQSDWTKSGETFGERLAAAAKQVAKAGIGGFISGGFSGGIYSGAQLVSNKVTDNRQMTANGAAILARNGADPLKQLALEMAAEENGLNAKSLTKAANKVTGDISRRNANKVGRLSDLMGETVQEQDIAEVKSELTKAGYSKSVVNQVVKAIRNGESISDMKDAEKIQAVVDNVTESDASEERHTNLTAARHGVRAKVNTEKATSGGVAIRNEVDVKEKVSESNETTQISTGEAVQIDKDNAIAKVEVVDGNRVVYYNTNKGVVEATDVAYASENDGLLYESFADMSPAFANAIIKNYDGSTPIQTYINGMREGVILYGAHNFQAVGKDISKDSNFADLSQADQAYALKLGRTYAKESAEAGSNAIKTAIKHAEERAAEAGEDTSSKKSKGGRVSFENGAKAATKSQRRAVQLAKILSKAIGMDIVFYDAKIKGTRHSDANGYFDKKTNTIHLDLQNSTHDAKTIVFTLSHELVHFIKQWSPAKFNTLANFLMEQYAAHGVSTEKLLANKMAEIGTTDADLAYEEVIADACERMLLDSNAVTKLAQLRKTDLSLFEKIKQHIANLLAKIRGEYRAMNYAPSSDEAKALQKMEDVLDKMHALFEEAAVDAAQNYQATIGLRSLEDFAAAETTDGEVLFQYKAIKADESAYRDMLKKWGKMSAAQIDNLFKTVDSAVNLIKNNLEILDYAWESDIDDRAFSPVKQNSDKLYQVSLDFSTLCRKRILQQTVAAHLQEALNKPLTKEEGIAIRDALIALQEEGRQIEVACALCYVESARMKSPEQIKRFLDNREDVIKEFFAGKSGGDTKARIAAAEAKVREALYREYPEGITEKGGTAKLDPRTAKLNQLPKRYADMIRAAKKDAKKAYVPTAKEQEIIDIAKGMTVTDFTTPEGLENLAKHHEELFDAYTSYVRNATKSKGIENDTWWRAGDSERIGDVLIANMNKENGLRSQSWSDFQVVHILDYIAATIELATRETKEQAYTKVPDYVELMGKTGVMINMSLIPTAEFNGKLDYDSVEGMDYKRALELRDKYHDTVGTICIGVDNAQIKLLLADITIDYVIPYHKSGMSAAIRKLMHIPTWSQYEEYQSEKNLSRAEAEKQAKKYGVKLLEASDPDYQKGTSFSEWFDMAEARQIAKMENANPSDKAKHKQYGVMYGGYMAMQNAANNYLRLCAERGLSPKFSHKNADFTAEDNYWKLLIDRKMVDNITGEVIEQQTIKPVFDRGEVMRILNDELARYPRVKEDQDYAVRKVTEAMLSGDVKGGMSAEAIAKAMKKPVDNVTNVNILASSEDGYTPSDLSATWGNIIETVGEDNIGEATEQLTDVENTATIMKQRKKASNTYEAIGKELLYYEEGNLAPDLTLVETVNERTGKKETTIKHYGQKPKGYVPQKIAYCYKLFEQHPDGTLHALFAGAKGTTPIGEWQYAQGFPYTDSGVKGMNLRERYGWHLSAGLPSAPHLMSSKSFERGYPSKNAYGHPKGSKRVWVRMAYDASTDFNTIADSTRAGDIFGLIPFGGYYAFKENNHSEWVISSAVKIDKILTEEERQQILEDAGYNEYEAWRKKHQPTPEDIAERDGAKKLSKAERDAQILESSRKMREAIKSRIIDNPELQDTVLYQKKAATVATDFVNHMKNIVDKTKGWKIEDVFDYIKDNPDLDFVERIYAKEKTAKTDLAAFLDEIDDHKTLHLLSWYVVEAYKRKDLRYNNSIRRSSPYLGAATTFRNAVNKRINDIVSGKVGGTKLGVKNGEVSLDYVKDMYFRLNGNDDMVEFAEKVFSAAERLGVNIAFANKMFDGKPKSGEELGDMIHYKTSFFNDTAVTDQKKANTILHELIHVCTTYVLAANQTRGDVYYRNKTANYEKISNAATRLNRIYDEVAQDPAFSGKYGVKNVKEFAAELSNPDFVELLKKKTLWEEILDFICELFGFRRGNYAYDNARMCVDYIIDNPEISEYKDYAIRARQVAHRDYGGAFGSTTLEDGQVRFQKKRDPSQYAPTFYSQMGKVIDGIKMDKIGASSVVNFLKGKGIRHDEIKWSGIEAFLEGKKSVTKAELQEFVAGSQLEIVEEMSGSETFVDEDGTRYYSVEDFKESAYVLAEYEGFGRDEVYFEDFGTGIVAYYGSPSEENEFHSAERDENAGRWSQYKLEGGDNYRELLFQMPNSTYSNRAMRTHWGDDAEGVLAHARIQDFETKNGKMLFIEEIQSDWHNEGHQRGYAEKLTPKQAAREAELKARVEKLRVERNALYKEARENAYSHTLFEKAEEITEQIKELNDELWEIYGADPAERLFSMSLPHREGVEDAPFRDNYHEYVLKRLIRMAADEGYDSIGWTTADIQSERWSEDYAEGYRIEYDQDIPKFLRKYGKKWGATVGQTMITQAEHNINGEHYDAEEIAVWSMQITEQMQQSVLYEGQPMYQKKQLTNRTILANALESTIDTSTQEGKNELAKLKEYQAIVGKIEELEAERAEVVEKAAKLQRTKGKTPEETKEMKGYWFESKQIANRISTYDKQLLRIEAMKPIQSLLYREKKMAEKRAEQKGREALARYREKGNETIRELMKRNRESREKGIDSRNKTEMRHKIKKVVSDLDHLLRHGSKERNIKIGLQAAVASALEAVNMDTVDADGRIANLEKELMQAKTPEKIQEVMRKIIYIRGEGDRMASKLEELRRAYADIKNSEQGVPDHYKNEASLIADKVDSVMKKVGNTPLRNMSLSQLEAVHDLYRMVLTTVQNANNLFVKGKIEDLQKNVSEIMMEEEAIKPLKEERLANGDWWRMQAWNEMIPVYAFERLGSKTLTKFFWDTVRGQNTFAVDISEAKAFSSAAREKYGYSKWDFGKIHEFKVADGRTFRLSLRHMMSIYAYSKREQALDHMSVGGFFFNDKETFRRAKGILKVIKSNEEGYKVNAWLLAKIKSAMTQEQLQYVDDMQEYLTKMGEKGNEVSRTLWGIDIFKEKVYFPLKSSIDFIYQANQPAKESSLKNDGMTKETIPHASNPIVLESFDDVWASHVERMSKYHAFVLPIENLNKIHNYGTWVGTASMSVSTMLRSRHSNAANEYLTRFIQDLNGASTMSGVSNPVFGFFNKFKKTAVAASTSVVVQQPTAILRATAVIDPKYFIGMPKMKRLTAKWAEIQKYAPIAIIKDIGGFDAGGGAQVSEWLNANTKRGVEKVMGKIDDITMLGAALGDQFGWSTIWEAVKRETKATTDLEEGSEEFLKRAGERFTEVIVLTQVYDSTLSRSGFMRSKHESVKMMTSFMGEPTVSFNMLMNAVVQLKNRKITKRSAVRTIGAVYASVLAASIAASMVYALRDDDDDESYIEKFANRLTGKLRDEVNPLNMLPIMRDIMSIMDGWDVERTDVAVFKDIKDAFDGLFSESKSAWRKVEDFAGAIASAFGIPAKNMLRTGREIYNLFENIFDSETPTGAGIGNAMLEAVTGQEKTNGQQLYEAMLSNDKVQIERVKARFDDQKDIDTAIRKALRDNDPRIKEAAAARYKGDIAEYIRIAKLIINEGHFSQDNIVAAINAEINAMKPASDSTESSKVDMYKVSDFYAAIANRDEATAYAVKESIIRAAVAEGKDRDDAEKSFYSSFAGICRDAYEAGEINDSNAIDMLVRHGDKTEEEAASKVQYWDFQMEYPDYDLSESAVTKYYEEVEPAGISVGIYYDYSKKRSKCTGTDDNGDGQTDSGSVKAEVLRVIDSLPISYEQKDVLYYLNGWSASTIWQAPWH